MLQIVQKSITTFTYNNTCHYSSNTVSLWLLMPMEKFVFYIGNLPILLIAVTQNPYLRPMVAEKKQNYRLKSTLKYTQNSNKNLYRERHIKLNKKTLSTFRYNSSSVSFVLIAKLKQQYVLTSESGVRTWKNKKNPKMGNLREYIGKQIY